MFGSQSSRRRPSAKWNIKLTYRWNTCVRVCVHVATYLWLCQETSIAHCASIAAIYTDTLIHTCRERQTNTHIHKFLTYIHYTQTTGCQEGQGNKWACVYVCWGWNSAGALGCESNAKLVLSSCQIIHDPASETIAEWLNLSSPRSLSISPMNDVLFKMSHGAQTSK